MFINDLDYLEVTSQESNVQGGFNLNDYSYVYFKEYFDLYKDIDVYANIYGNVATAEADADAYGKNTLSQTFTDAKVYQGYYSGSNSVSIAAAAPY